MIGTEIAEGRMAALIVVPALDVARERGVSQRARWPHAVRTEFILENGKETLDHRIIPTVAFATHAAREAVRGQERAVRTARILHAPIGVMHHARRGPP